MLYLVVTSASCSTLGCEPPNVVVPHPVTTAFISSNVEVAEGRQTGATEETKVFKLIMVF